MHTNMLPYLRVFPHLADCEVKVSSLSEIPISMIKQTQKRFSAHLNKP
jgi:hypothetical protein